MEQKFQVIWAKSAFDDLGKIIDYIAQNNPLTAQKLLNQIKNKIETLCYLPHRGRHIPELQKQGILIYRELIIPPWRVMYRVSKNKVYILPKLSDSGNRVNLGQDMKELDHTVWHDIKKRGGICLES